MMHDRYEADNNIFGDFWFGVYAIQEIDYLIFIGFFVFLRDIGALRKYILVLFCAVKQNDSSIVVKHRADLLLYQRFVLLYL
jgi:hypothetical protein